MLLGALLVDGTSLGNLVDEDGRALVEGASLGTKLGTLEGAPVGIDEGMIDGNPDGMDDGGSETFEYFTIPWNRYQDSPDLNKVSSLNFLSPVKSFMSVPSVKVP
mmetsp:Transcript_32278/g.78141  ORF Transcript_32278/g.78141 Transcript_32278/m.78141 type:complete len:105 (+) Transcript_32278:662-976(+)